MVQSVLVSSMCKGPEGDKSIGYTFKQQREVRQKDRGEVERMHCEPEETEGAKSGWISRVTLKNFFFLKGCRDPRICFKQGSSINIICFKNTSWRRVKDGRKGRVITTTQRRCDIVLV